VGVVGSVGVVPIDSAGSHADSVVAIEEGTWSPQWEC